MLLVESSQILDVLFAAQKDGTTLVDAGGLDVEDSACAGDGEAAGLFCEHGHGKGFVEDAEFAVFALLVVGVAKDAAVEEGAVDVCDHGTAGVSGVYEG